jgi:O-antigen biosynthesis protein
MDAETRTTIAVEHIIEPFSGLALLRATGYWQGPASSSPPRAAEVRFDGVAAIRFELAASSGIDVPPGHVRLNIGTQLPVEVGVREVAVVLLHDSGETNVYRRLWKDVGTTDAAPRPRLLARSLRSIASGEAFSPWRWSARFSRFAEKLLELRQRVRYKLLARRFRPRSPHDAYVDNTAITPRMRQAMLAAIGQFHFKPTLSLLVPVYNVDPRWLKEAIESVRRQIYPHWEFCLADDCSTDPALLRYLDNLPNDSRIKLVRRKSNGHICHATNSAADLASGEFIALLDHDDALAPHALFAMAERLQQHPDADLLYSDEDKIDAAGHRYDPQFKPDWSPELLLSYNYVNHFTVIRRSVFEKAGRYRPGFEGSQDHDLLLRVTELTNRVQHVPSILYHWRSLPTSTAAAATVKSYVHVAGRKAVDEACKRRGLRAALFVPPFARKLGLPVLALDGPDDGPSVAILVFGEAAAARRTMAAIRRITTYNNYSQHAVPIEPNAAEALNQAVSGRAEELLLFLEAGAEPRDPRWLARLVAHAAISGVGAVGGKLLAPDGSVADAGTIAGLRDGLVPAPAFAGLPPDQISYYFYAEVTRNVAAVSGRCLLTRRETFDRLGGLDARRYPDSLWNVDYCLRLRNMGLRCALVASVVVVLAGDSRAGEPKPIELLVLKRAYGRLSDPFHNPNCSEHQAWLPSCDSPLSLPLEASRPPVRALVVAHNLNNPEGAPRYLSEIVIGLRDRGAIDPMIVSSLGGPGARAYTDARIGVDVRESPFSRRFIDGLWSPREYEAALKTAAKLLREHRPEVVIANTLMTFPFVEAAARAGIPAVWIIHESYSPAHRERLFPPFARKRVEQAFSLAARVIPASHDTAKLFENLNTRGNVRVIHNGLDAKPFDDYRARTPEEVSNVKRFVAVGTICERKGQHTLVEAAAILARERRDFACDLVGLRGGIPYADYVRQLVHRHRLDDLVNLVPETDEVWKYYRNADAFVCTSHLETFSRAVLEAEAFGLPILSTPVCGVSEQVFWDANALRFEFGDAAGLAGQMRRLLVEEGLRREMAEESRAAFELHLNQDEMLDRYGAVILAAARRGPRSQLPLAVVELASVARRAA